MLFSESIFKYIEGFKINLPKIPSSVQFLLPYEADAVRLISDRFYNAFYADINCRKLILGINPGRLGAGMTGVPFTDSKRLIENCNIETEIQCYEPSSEFIYQMITAYGGVEKFYKNYFISSVSPIGFVKDGKNFNYYDDPKIYLLLEPYIEFQIGRLKNLNLHFDEVYCLGEGQNYKWLKKLNARHHWFGTIVPLAHPRYVMQYKRILIKSYINLYINCLL